MKLHKLTPNFEVKDIRETVTYYESVLGFTLLMAVAETQDGIGQTLVDEKKYVYALVGRDNVEIMFQRTDSFKKDISLSKGLPIGASVSFYMEIEGIEDFFNEINKKNIKTTELKTTWYGMREFYITDNNGYILGFAEKNS